MSSESRVPTPPKPAELAQRGVDLCRQDRWKDGLEWLLIAVNAAKNRTEALPALSVAYLGYAMARVEGQKSTGLKLCRSAIRREFYHPELYGLLARIYLLHGEKHGAVAAIEKGLSIDPESTGLHLLRRELGVRRPPVLPMLSRSHPLNRLFAKLRSPARKSEQRSARSPEAGKKPSPPPPTSGAPRKGPRRAS